MCHSDRRDGGFGRPGAEESLCSFGAQAIKANRNSSRFSLWGGNTSALAREAVQGSNRWEVARINPKVAAAITSPSHRACARLLSKPFWSHPLGSASAGSNGKGDRT